ncbi:LamB/YcsF family protein, partial [Francisella tularensis subsp. holarctica]|nr:LamB/YcsF family protein [Francisella tularensis subsp. holarctica]
NVLCESFDQQFELFYIDIKDIKPKVFLYNQLNVDKELAKTFIQCCIKNNIYELLFSQFVVFA